MLQPLSLEQFLNLAKTAQRIAVYREIAADRLTPIGVVEQLHNEMQDGVLLESGLNQHEDGRYSHIAFDALAQIESSGDCVTQRVGLNTTQCQGDPFQLLRKLQAELACASQVPDVKFINGAVGFVTYDAVRLLEAIPNQHVDEHALPDLFFKFYRTTLVFDHVRQALLISTIVEVEADLVACYQTAQVRIDALVHKLTQPLPSSPVFQTEPCSTATTVTVDVSDETYRQLVVRAKQHIIDGDAFQIVLSRRFSQPYSAHPFEIYRVLRRVSPAPYMFYFPMGNTVVLGASPEKMVSVHEGQVEVNPIAGTRRRLSVADEVRNAEELLSDEKELAEHQMLVDLARNDLGAICTPGSVHVKSLLQVKHFSHVTHLTSVVTGQLSSGKDALDAFCATFPAGTVSGAPKIRAMQLIDALETSKRGLYAGALCRLDDQGHFDSCIAIRMAILRDGMATVRTGAGIVFDSDPALEAAETRQKAQGILTAILLAEGISA